ncbi:hypothetical protein ABW20_dc0102214 [Dactylellina cionopaga]|nr:hypothetical protein ABW20_dc0102214 [Dactylellina cionopaga]
MPRRRKSLTTSTNAQVPGAAPVLAQNSAPVPEEKFEKPAPPLSKEKLYDDPEALKLAIEASEQDASSWTTVARKLAPAIKTFGTGYQRQHSGHNAVFPARKNSPRLAKTGPRLAPPQSKSGSSPPTKTDTQAAKNSQTEIKIAPKKENKKPVGKRNKVEHKLPVFDSVEEFPTLTTSKELLVRQKPDTASEFTGPDMDVEPTLNKEISVGQIDQNTEELQVNVRKSENTVEKVDETKVVTKEIQTELVSDIDELPMSEPPKSIIDGDLKVPVEELSQETDKDNEPYVAAERPTVTPEISSVTLDTSSIDVIADVSASTDTPSSMTTGSQRGSVLFLEDRIAFKSTTKKERRAAKKAASIDNTPKMSIKERAEARRKSSEAKNKPEIDGKEFIVDSMVKQPTSEVEEVVKPSEDVILATSNTVEDTEPTIITTGKIEKEGTPAEDKEIQAVEKTAEAADAAELVEQPIIKTPRTVRIASGTTKGINYQVLAIGDAMKTILEVGKAAAAAKNASAKARQGAITNPEVTAFTVGIVIHGHVAGNTKPTPVPINSQVTRKNDTFKPK